MPSTTTLLSAASLLASIPTVFAGFSPSSTGNIAVYWGQNSYGQSSGSLEQQRLSTYCANSQFDIIPLAFLTTISNPALNFANSGNDCTAISGSNLFYCSELEADIAECQSTYGKTILLSIGGATYTEGGFSSESDAVAAANNIWSIFGPYSSSSSAPRPFGKSVIDGFDFDFETTVSNMPAFGNQLRSLMDADTSKKWLLTAAPQCPYPDAADGPMLAGTVSFDIVWVQFYNNYCGLNAFTTGSTTQNNFNFETWDNWAKTSSLNPNVKVMLGIPANTGAAGSGYESGSTLADIIAYCKSFSSFGGVMMWDMTQLYANSGFLSQVVSDLGNAAASVPATSTATTLTTVVGKPTSTISTTASATATGSGGVAQWGQCGGDGYTGPTVCASPYTCVYSSEWWSQCQ
ncbi:carbohydrate-binding module family 1 protein [Amorphotheca resinae ATCC 22711]|uniref:chitinase n=1 Tax=Amorphotheca resinae ATCC 22711 TaxID=857342 RepID=A0A2T3AYK3_AMORE|nr:carbohydrate-binding module family 1 protein [Amorphotheca resinae ATCC 22711]PSS15133.1 carbohydrate-binding module family 1 protein [Amorphotheca resinae ATCC 22711]